MLLNNVASQLSYDPETGIFNWKVNKKGHRKSGDIAGSRHSRGYVQIAINGKSYLAHRLALLMSGIELSAGDQVDHINGDRADNRLSNLRVATHAENCRNAKTKKTNKSGLKGCHFDSRRQLYRARISFNKKTIWLGYYPTAEEAHAAYCAAATKLHGNFSKMG